MASFQEICGKTDDPSGEYTIVGEEPSSFHLSPTGYGKGSSLLSDAELDLDDEELDLSV